MAKEKKVPKRPRGRPLGREMTHIARAPMPPAMWQELQAIAKQEGKSAGAIIRELIANFIKRYPRA